MPVEILAGMAVGAAIASPKVRKTIRQGLVYGLAGALITFDKAVAIARGVGHGVKQGYAATAQSPPNDAAAPNGQATTPDAPSVKDDPEAKDGTANGCAAPVEKPVATHA